LYWRVGTPCGGGGQDKVSVDDRHGADAEINACLVQIIVDERANGE